ncbi:MAG: hypothetical protein IKV62_06650 [Bacteroidales bacterium]|nr:hypothetical protein [Bacteroidales bacterium]
MKKCIISFIIACLSLTSSLLTFQAAAQDTQPVKEDFRPVLWEKQRNATCITGPRFELLPAPTNPETNTVIWFKFDKETGETWVIENNFNSVKVRKIDKELGWRDNSRPGEINYQLIVASKDLLLLLNLNTGTMWESHQRAFSFRYTDFKELDMGI